MRRERSCDGFGPVLPSHSRLVVACVVVVRHCRCGKARLGVYAMRTGPRTNAMGRASCRCGDRSAGFSLIELMIAMMLGLLVAEGIYLLFASSSRANAVQL